MQSLHDQANHEIGLVCQIHRSTYEIDFFSINQITDSVAILNTSCGPQKKQQTITRNSKRDEWQILSH